MDEINIGPKRDFRLPSWRWFVAAVAAGLIAAAGTLIAASGGDRHIRHPPGPSTVAAAPTPPPTAAPGTVLLTCDSANWGQLAPNWRHVSLRAGPLWFVNGRQGGYVHYGSPQDAGRTDLRRGKVRLGVMIVEVTDGSTVVMNVAPAARSYFHFLGGFGPGVGYRLANGATGFTFSSCPSGSTGPNGKVTDFYLGFAIEADSRAPVEVWRSPSARPILVTFTCPGRGCDGLGPHATPNSPARPARRMSVSPGIMLPACASLPPAQCAGHNQSRTSARAPRQARVDGHAVSERQRGTSGGPCRGGEA